MIAIDLITIAAMMMPAVAAMSPAARRLAIHSRSNACA